MHLDRLELTGFRGHGSLTFEPDRGINVLVGPNGAGKTSLLEAIAYLVGLSSLRRVPDAALISSAASEAIIRGAFSVGPRSLSVEVEIPTERRRRVLVNGKATQSRAAIAEWVALVAFVPDDLDLVKRGPSLRRDFLDDAAVQFWPAAALEQREYERALRQRNALLRSRGRDADRATLDVWDDRLARLGSVVLTRRLAVLDEIRPDMSAIYAGLSDAGDDVSWEYVAADLESPSADDRERIAAMLLEAVTRRRRADMERRTTTVGPHRDELVMAIGGREARTRSSQGEQRSLALALRLSVHRVLTKRRGDPPILLLDDVLSELDPVRSRRVVEELRVGQVFVTSARRDDVPLTGRRWSVAPGEVVPA